LAENLEQTLHMGSCLKVYTKIRPLYHSYYTLKSMPVFWYWIWNPHHNMENKYAVVSGCCILLSQLI